MLSLVPRRRRKEDQFELMPENWGRLSRRRWGRDIFSSVESMLGGDWFPKIDLSEGGKEITVKAEMPGMDPKDIEVSLVENRLSIKGEKKKEEEEKDENFHRLERSYGYFSRTIELPAEVDPGDVDASYKEGVLKIKLKKTKETEPRKIDIKAEAE